MYERHQGVQRRELMRLLFVSLTLSKTVFTLLRSAANLPCLAFTIIVQSTMWLLSIVFSTITLPICTLQATNITQRNTRSVLGPNYRRHTQLVTQLRGRGDMQNHSRRVWLSQLWRLQPMLQIVDLPMANAIKRHRGKKVKEQTYTCLVLLIL